MHNPYESRPALTSRWCARASHLCLALGLASACSLIQPEPELPLYPGAGRRPINPYGEPPDLPTPPIVSGESALAIALRDQELLRHVQRIDAKYSGRRRQSLAWTGRARFENQLASDEEAEGSESRSPSENEGEAGQPTDLRQSEEELLRAIEADGGYWKVAIASNVRETNIFYECELVLSTQGKPLIEFRTNESCGWKGDKGR